MLTAFGMILMVLLLLIGANYTIEHVEHQRQQVLLSLGYTLQDELILATTVNEGYEHDIDLPQQLGRFHYEIETTIDSFTLTSGSQAYLFLTPNMTGAFSKGTNTIRYDGELSIT